MERLLSLTLYFDTALFGVCPCKVVVGSCVKVKLSWFWVKAICFTELLLLPSTFQSLLSAGVAARDIGSDWTGLRHTWQAVG